MRQVVGLMTLALAITVLGNSTIRAADPPLLTAGIAEVDITPQLGAKPVYMAGFGQNRKATGVHDPLMARAMVLKDGQKKLALVSVDLVGFFHANVLRVRGQLAGFDYVLISSTHNHEGPDTLGLWGPNAFSSGIDRDYMKSVEGKIVQVVREAERGAVAVRPRLGTVSAPELLHDGREPYVKHDELVAIEFRGADGKPADILVQWNCHPETLSSQNTQLSADFVGYTVRHLREKYKCPVLYLTGTVGGLMTSLNVPIKSEGGQLLADGTFEKTERYGRLIGQLTEKAIQSARPVQLTPFTVRTQNIFLPLDNKLYIMGRQLGVLDRPAFAWKNSPTAADPVVDEKEFKGRFCMQTEIGWLRLGELEVAAIPGEIYPELVLGRVQDPPDKGADFPDAPIEPSIYAQMKSPYRMLIGLANDEIGYIIPKRQWDEKPPFCYGRTKAQYGETNSIGPDAAPILCEAFQKLVSSGGGK